MASFHSQTQLHLIKQFIVTAQIVAWSPGVKINILQKGHWDAVIHLQFWAYGSWDSLFPISMSPHCKLMSPKHYF